MGKETNFTLAFNRIGSWNIGLITETKNPIVFNEFIEFDERHPSDYGFRALKSFPEGSIFNKGVNFFECNSLKSIPAHTVFKGDTSFFYCSLESISEGVIFNGNVVFMDCPNLKSIPENTIFNGNVEFTSEYKKPKGYVSKEMENFLVKMKKQGKIAGTLYI